MNLQTKQHNFLFNLVSGQDFEKADFERKQRLEDEATELEIEHALEEAQERDVTAMSMRLDRDIETLKQAGEEIPEDINELHDRAREIRADQIENQQFKHSEITKSNTCEIEE